MTYVTATSARNPGTFVTGRYWVIKADWKLLKCYMLRVLNVVWHTLPKLLICCREPAQWRILWWVVIGVFALALNSSLKWPWILTECVQIVEGHGKLVEWLLRYKIFFACFFSVLRCHYLQSDLVRSVVYHGILQDIECVFCWFTFGIWNELDLNTHTQGNYLVRLYQNLTCSICSPGKSWKLGGSGPESREKCSKHGPSLKSATVNPSWRNCTILLISLWLLVSVISDLKFLSNVLGM